jgi:hypothetical protein
MCVCIHQSESIAAQAAGPGWIDDWIWIASRPVARSAMVGFAEARPCFFDQKAKSQYNFIGTLV